jgi:hypothetical protein
MAGRGDESVAQLLANLPPRVRQLRLASKSIAAVGADAIAAALSTPTRGVRSVSLECNQLGNEGARALAAVALGADIAGGSSARATASAQMGSPRCWMRWHQALCWSSTWATPCWTAGDTIASAPTAPQPRLSPHASLAAS